MSSFTVLSINDFRNAIFALNDDYDSQTLCDAFKMVISDQLEGIEKFTRDLQDKIREISAEIHHGNDADEKLKFLTQQIETLASGTSLIHLDQEDGVHCSEETLEDRVDKSTLDILQNVMLLVEKQLQLGPNEELLSLTKEMKETKARIEESLTKRLAKKSSDRKALSQVEDVSHHEKVIYRHTRPSLIDDKDFSQEDGVFRYQRALEDQWDVDLYKSKEEWKDALKEHQKTDYSKLGSALKEKEKLSPKEILELADLYFNSIRAIRKISRWITARHDEDRGNEEIESLFKEYIAKSEEIEKELSWVEDKISMSIPEENLEQWIEENGLSFYSHFLQKMLVNKNHMPAPKDEAMIAKAVSRCYMLHSDFKSKLVNLPCSIVRDKDGHEHEASKSTYLSLMSNPDPILRRNTYYTSSSNMHWHIVEFTAMLSEFVHLQLDISKANKYDSWLEASLDVTVEVFKDYIKSVRENICALHDFVSFKRKALQLDDGVHMYDLNLLLLPQKSTTYSYREAMELCLSAVKPLGKEYEETLRKGLMQEHWVDPYPNMRKIHGAYAIESYDGHPLILMNFTGDYESISTLAHEAGHAMHHLYTCKSQPFHACTCSAIIQEIPSLTNQELLAARLIGDAEQRGDLHLKVLYLQKEIEHITESFFLMTLLSELELFMYENVANGVEITPELLNQKYLELLKFYYGPDAAIDECSQYMWASIEHFYLNFYLCTYGIGQMVAMVLSERILQGDTHTVESYQNFLKAGNSQFSLDLMKTVNIDLADPELPKFVVQKFKRLCKELEETLAQIEKDKT